MGLRRLAKMLFTYRMPGFLSVSRQPESTRLVPMWPGMRLRLIDSFPGQPCAMREREIHATGIARRFSRDEVAVATRVAVAATGRAEDARADAHRHETAPGDGVDDGRRLLVLVDQPVEGRLVDHRPVARNQLKDHRALAEAQQRFAHAPGNQPPARD